MQLFLFFFFRYCTDSYLKHIINVLFLAVPNLDSPVFTFITTNAIPEELLYHFADGKTFRLSNGLDLINKFTAAYDSEVSPTVIRKRLLSL